VEASKIPVQILAKYSPEQLEEAKDVLLDLRGRNEHVVDTALRLCGEKGWDGESNFDDRTDFRELCRNIALANKEIYETLIQRNETGDSEYDRTERSKPKCKTLKELISTLHKEKAAEWSDASSTIAIHSRILHMLGDIRLDQIDRDFT
jgi:hypothetical protein